MPLVQKLSATETSVLQEGYVIDRLANISSYAAAISPDKALLVPNNNLNYTSQPTQLTQRAHSLGMMVFPSLFRNENEFLLYTFGADPHRVSGGFERVCLVTAAIPRHFRQSLPKQEEQHHIHV